MKIYEVWGSEDSCGEHSGWIEVPYSVFLMYTRSNRRIIEVLPDNDPVPEGKANPSIHSARLICGV